MEEKEYLINCERCRKKTAHRISNLSVRKGIKLSCTICGFEKRRWIKSGKIKDKEIQDEA